MLLCKITVNPVKNVECSIGPAIDKADKILLP